MLSKSIPKAGCISVGVVFACIKCAVYIDIIVHQNFYYIMFAEQSDLNYH